jgi:DNA-binding NarL/FixJ family response regulator
VVVAGEKEPDVILLDFGFPEGIQGDELLIQVKRNSPHIKIVMITGESREHIRSRMLNLGADVFLIMVLHLKKFKRKWRS